MDPRSPGRGPETWACPTLPPTPAGEPSRPHPECCLSRFWGDSYLRSRVPGRTLLHLQEVGCFLVSCHTRAWQWVPTGRRFLCSFGHHLLKGEQIQESDWPGWVRPRLPCLEAVASFFSWWGLGPRPGPEAPGGGRGCVLMT